MANYDDLHSWASREGLSEQTVDVLMDQGYSSLEDLKELAQEDFVHFEKLFKVRQLVNLKKAITKLGAGNPTPALSSTSHDFAPSPLSSTSSSAPQSSYLPTVQSLLSDFDALNTDDSEVDDPQPKAGQVRERIEKFNQQGLPKAKFPDQRKSAAQQGFLKGFPFFGGKEEIAEEFRFILVGKTGSGKSMTGNTILGKDLFTASLGFRSVTTECELQKNVKNGKAIEIMDCPGLYDTSRSQQDISHVIVKAVACSHPGPHAILFVIRFGRFTAEENGVYDRLKALFDDDIANYIVVIFTGGDDLARSKSSLADLLKNAPRGLIDLVNECNNRCVVFDNTAKNKKPPVEELLEQVRRMKEENGDTPYTCPKYIAIGQRLEAEINKRLQEVTDRDREKEQHIQQLKEKMQEILGSVEEIKEELKKKEEEIKKITEEKKKYEADIEKLRQEPKEATEEKKKEEEKLAQQQNDILERLGCAIKKMEELEEERCREEQETQRRRTRALDRMKQGIAQGTEEGWVDWAAKGVANVIAAPFKWVGSLLS